MPAAEAPSAQQRVFSPPVAYKLVPLVFVAIGVLGSGYVGAHNKPVGIFIWVLTGLFLLASALMLSLRVGFSATGLTQRWLASRASASWRDVARLEQSPGRYALRDAKGRDLVLLHLLPLSAQQVIAEEAIARAGLRPARETPKPPIINAWERKK